MEGGGLPSSGSAAVQVDPASSAYLPEQGPRQDVAAVVQALSTYQVKIGSFSPLHEISMKRFACPTSMHSRSMPEVMPLIWVLVMLIEHDESEQVLEVQPMSMPISTLSEASTMHLKLLYVGPPSDYEVRHRMGGMGETGGQEELRQGVGGGR